MRLAPEPRIGVSVMDKGAIWSGLEQGKAVPLGGYP